ncbi:hypothetical protein [Sulfitobacter sp.]|uniref:hypothetical protein n=1 Tax=Sulfitobacter sp. TaxID=1903071 RepID=UPI0030033244
MAYLLTAVMTGGVSALLSLLNGGSFADVLWNYVVFGHLGIVALALAVVMSSAMSRLRHS